jgi:hypothetical protein
MGSITLTGIYTGIYNTLAGGTALTSLVGGTVTPRIYNKQAPDAATTPFVIFSQQAGGPMLINPSELSENIIFVRAWGSTDASSRQVFDVIDGLLDKKVLTLTGFTNLWCARENDLDAVEDQPDGTKRYMYGGLYRIQIDK